MKKFGYPDKRGKPDRLNFGGVHKFNQKYFGTGLTLKLEGYDFIKKKINDVNGGIILTNDIGEIALKWNFSKLIERWQKKHAQTVYIPSQKKINIKQFYRYGHIVALCEGTNFNKFLSSFINESVFYDPGISLKNISSSKPKSKKRSQLRTKPNDIPLLYNKCEEVNLLNLNIK